MPGTTPELGRSIVRAGAGAGKTTGLVARVKAVYLKFKAEGLRPRIVVTTFTRKATQELKERLIRSACKDEDVGFLQFVTDPSHLQISTIHGLLNIFLRQVGHLAGLDAGFQIVSEVESAQLARLALRETVLAHPEGLNWLETYGFTRVLSMLRAYEHARREAGDMQSASFKDLEAAVAEFAAKWKAELNELASSILEEVDDAKWIEYANGMRSFLKTWSGSRADLDKLPSKPRNSKSQEHLSVWHERTQETIEQFKKELKSPGWNHELWPKMANEWKAFTEFADEFVRRSWEQKDASARLEMADLELKSMEILREVPGLGKIFAENWDYWMIDEYQDTSPLQAKILQALIGEQPRYYVGDPQQSIYLFRGADVRVFEEAWEETVRFGGEAVELRRNYRSEPDLLMWINSFMNGVGPAFKDMEAREAPGKSERPAVKMIRTEDEAAELNAVVARVGELLAGGAKLEQICVLGRTHKTLMDVSRALRERGYPTHVHSSRGFSERREVLDAQALWKFLINPHDNFSLMILLRSPWFYVEDAKLSSWMQDKPSSLWLKLVLLKESETPESIVRLRAAHLKVGRMGLARAFESTLCASAMIDLSLVNDPAGRKESNLWKLVLRAREIERDGGQSLLDFLDQDPGSDALDASEGDATSAQEPNSINLMTIHGSKGLEFDHVIVPRMGEASPPSQNASLAATAGKFHFPVWADDAEDAKSPFIASPLDELKRREDGDRKLEEFDRWLYVALTRAKSTLTLSWSKIARKSWAWEHDHFLLEPGTHSQDFFSFEISDQPGEPQNYSAKTRDDSKIRKPWRARDGEHVERLSVTDLVKVKATEIVPREDLLKRWQAQNQGTRIHRTLEALKYGLQPEENDKATNYVLSIDKPPMRELIAAGEAEWGFQVRTPTQVVEGQIDLWAKHNGVLYVVDYKSGSQKFEESAFKQLSLYAWALRKFGHKEPIQRVVIYPLTEKIKIQEFTEELFDSWELEFSGTKT